MSTEQTPSTSTGAEESRLAGLDENESLSDANANANANTAEAETESSDAHDFQIKESNEVTTYNAQSEIRNPIKLFSGIAADFWQGRELAWRLFLRNIRGMYRQTLLGLFWAFLPPIANTAVWIYLRELGVLKIEVEGVDAVIYVLTGMILWQAFVDAFKMPAKVLAQNRNMISKLRFSRESLLLVGFGEVLFDFAIRLLLLVPAMFIYGAPWYATLWLAPLAVLMMVLFAMSLGLLVMPLGSLYQDVGRFITLAMPFWMILTPIVYAVKPENPVNWLNPASPLLLLARDWVLIGSSQSATLACVYAALTIPLLLFGLAVYRVSIPVLVERMNA